MCKLENEDKNYYGENVGWLCREVAIPADDAREDYMIPDDIDVYFEDEHGRDTSAAIDIPKLLMSAHMEIDRLSKEVGQLKEDAEDAHYEFIEMVERME